MPLSYKHIDNLLRTYNVFSMRFVLIWRKLTVLQSTHHETLAIFFNLMKAQTWRKVMETVCLPLAGEP